MKKKTYLSFSLLIILAFFGGYLLNNIKDSTSVKTVTETTKYTTGVNIEDFGAKSIESSPGFDSRKAIQAAIDSGAKEIYIPFGKTYEISIDGQTYEGKGTGIGLKLHDNLRIYGGGTIKAKNNTGGSFALLANTNDTIKNLIIEGITIDGNSSHAKSKTHRSNLVLFGAENCHYLKVTSVNSPYVGLMMRGNGGQKNTIKDSTVENSGYIGIQAQKHDGIIISENKVYRSKDNAYDIEGNDLKGGALNKGTGEKVIIINNIADGSKTGIFIESTGRVIVTGNHIFNTTSGGFYMNRMNSGSFYNVVSNNEFINEESPGKYIGGMIANSSGKSMIHHNIFKGFLVGIETRSKATNLVIDHNYFSEISQYLIYPKADDYSLVKSEIGINYYEDSQVNRFPRTIPKNSSKYPNRIFNVSVTPAKSLETNKKLQETQ
ncbi:right-handed parallel beta-helix repeat-containing protein [Priestia megaterium]|uniref:right-handed parallel beta-helix repeat-containing protein n=1 Tax=Priestia megaterium TaxID=1404 RepID=UPI002E1A5617|nr:right-handed parallel beta-helix repeat-containing protein [Priestia megaterium]